MEVVYQPCAMTFLAAPITHLLMTSIGISLVPLLDILRHNGDISLSIASAVAAVQWGSTAWQRRERRLTAQTIDATEQEFKLPVRT